MRSWRASVCAGVVMAGMCAAGAPGKGWAQQAAPENVDWAEVLMDARTAEGAGAYEKAAKLYGQVYAQTKNPEHVYMQVQALRQAGEARRAQVVFRVNRAALEQMAKPPGQGTPVGELEQMLEEEVLAQGPQAAREAEAALQRGDREAMHGHLQRAYEETEDPIYVWQRVALYYHAERYDEVMELLGESSVDFISVQREGLPYVEMTSLTAFRREVEEKRAASEVDGPQRPVGERPGRGGEERGRGAPVLAWSLVGSGVVAGGVGAWSLVSGQSLRRAMICAGSDAGTYDVSCDGAAGYEGDPQQDWQQDWDRAQRRRTVGRVLIAGGAGLVLGGVAALFVPRATEKRAHTTPTWHWTPHPTGLTLHTTF